MNQQGTTAAKFKKKSSVVSLHSYPQKPHLPQCLLNADLASVPTPRTAPPAVITAVSCIPVAEHLKIDRNGLLGQLKESLELVPIRSH